ncbi:transporter [Clostridia bacterium]|nr:transporter [Clostridia bacterium]
MAAKYGGGIFLLVYVILALTFGFTLMVTEIALGRKTGQSVIGAYSKLSKKWGFLGLISAFIPMIIVSYYCVIGGWVTKYLAEFFIGSGTAAASNSYFGDFISKPFQPIVWFGIFVLLTFVFVLLGVQKGIENAGKIFMPILIILLIAITVYSLTLPGAVEGVVYYLKPDFAKFTPQAVLAAMGQMFYSMSLAMGIMVTYGSYMKKEENIEQAVKQIEWFDTGIALLAGLMIIPAVFAFSGGDETAINAGPSMMFVTMPKVFANMGFAGNIIGAAFFLLVLFAALTSSISLAETVVSVFQDKFNFSRIKSCLITLAIILLFGVPCSLGFGVLGGITLGGMTILDIFDFVSNSIMMPIVALLTCIFIGFILNPDVVVHEVSLAGKFRREKMYRIFIKYIAPLMLIAILVSAILNSLGLIKL